MSLALSALKTNVMLADAKYRIIFVNPSLHSFLKEAEADIRTALPNFSADALVGKTIDAFHRQPDHQHALLGGITQTHSSTIRIGSRIFDLHVHPLRRGSKLAGFAVEWADARTRLQNLDYAAQIAAFGQFLAVVEFAPDGRIITANKRFLDTVGYGLEEIAGHHHSMFCEPEEVATEAYRDHWRSLAHGEARSGEFKRLGKNNRLLWLQGQYTPILDKSGKVTKLVKFVTDVTARVTAVAAVGDRLSRLAQGDLRGRLERPLPTELDQLRTDLNTALDSLEAAMRSVSRSVETIRSGTGEISTAADDFSRRTEQQAATLEETAAALDEVTATVKRTADGAKRARQVVGTAAAEAQQSGAVVRDAVAAMHGIERSSKAIGQIIGVIDEIAFQTNLLALNAGVEAARAGEAGRGFAVVASEVRGLAQRSAEAAKEIKTLISDSSAQVDQGVSLVGRAGKALEHIAVQVEEVNGMVAEIAASAQEQATALDEVNTAVNQMDQATQQNAAMVEQSTAASHSLAGECDALTELMGRFRTQDDRAGAQRPGDAARASAPRAVLRTSGPGGAARKAEPRAAAVSWEEF